MSKYYSLLVQYWCVKRALQKKVRFNLGHMNNSDSRQFLETNCGVSSIYVCLGATKACNCFLLIFMNVWKENYYP